MSVKPDTANPRFLFHLRMVAVAHVLIVLVIAGWSGWRGCRKPRTEVLLPVEFMVNVAAKPEAPSTEPFLPPEPEPAVKETPKPKPLPEPVPKPKRKEIDVSREKVVKTLNREKPQPKRLSDEEIRKRLAMNATPGTRDILPPSEEALGFEMVRRAMYKAWNQPGTAEVGDVTAGVTLRLDSSGRVLSSELNRPSGNAVMDVSVRQALLAVSRIEGLSSGFLSRHQVITVTFKVE